MFFLFLYLSAIVFIFLLLSFFSQKRLLSVGIFCRTDDDDMKIVHSPADFKNLGSTEESVTENHDLWKQKKAGNMEKAKSLGRMLAWSASRFNGYFDETNFLVCEQMRMLYTFSVLSALYGIENDILSETAYSSFLEALQIYDSWLYDQAQISGSFSRYLLIARDNRLADEEYGKVFAKLCYHTNEKKWERRGLELFHIYSAAGKQIIINTKFDD